MARLSSEVKDTIAHVAGADFILVELRDGDSFPVYDHTGELMKFRSGADASQYANRLTSERGYKVQPRRVNDKDWRSREQVKFKDGTYRPLPWAGRKWWIELKEVHQDHFPHVSVQKQALIAFTESEEKGSADIQTVIKPGKYFERFFGDKVNDYMIRDLCVVFAAKFEVNEVLFAETADEIEEIYVAGPQSCMSKTKEHYPTGGIHPVRAYAAGDLQVAYIMREGQIKARTVVWPAKKIYSPHIYGDKGRMEPMLKKLGYHSGVPIGARLAKHRVPAPKGGGGSYSFVLPHVDGANTVEVKDDCLVVSQKGDASKGVLQFGGGTGVTESFGHVCPKCTAVDLRARDLVGVVCDLKGTSVMWCAACKKSHTVSCCESGYIVDKTLATELYGGSFVWNHYLSHTRVCEEGRRVLSGNALMLTNGTWWTTHHYRANGTTCATCGGYRSRTGPCGCKHEEK